MRHSNKDASPFAGMIRGAARRAALKRPPTVSAIETRRPALETALLGYLFFANAPATASDT